MIAAHEGFLWLVSEFVAHGTLRDALYSESKAWKELSWSLRVQWTLDCVQALAFIHSKSLMHRDIKSENLLLDSSNKVKVCDFGFARKIDKKLATMADKKKMAQLTIAGTDEWMAPEVIQGLPYGQPADIFSFGVTLTEMILRRAPEERHPRNAFDFEVEEFNAALKALGDPPCPPEFSALVIHCCKYEPKDRPEAKVLVRGVKELLKVVSEREKVAVGDISSPRATSAAPVSPDGKSSVPGTDNSNSPAGVSSPRDERSGSRGGAASEVSPRPPRLDLLPGSSATSLGLGGLGAPLPPYVGITPTEDDYELASMLPDENGMFRSIPLSSKLGDHRLKWIFFQDANPNQHAGWLKMAAGPDFKKDVKYFFVLCLDVLYFFKNNKKGERNLGRILIDSSMEFAVQETGKKKLELTLTNWLKKAVRLRGSVDEIRPFNSALLEAKSSGVLNLAERFQQSSKTTAGMTRFTQSGETYSFPVRVAGSVGTLLLCLNRQGVFVLSAFVEDVMAEVPWEMVVHWQISRNDNVEITFLFEKKKRMVDFQCLAWVQASHVFNALEAISKCSGTKVASPPPRSPRTSVGGLRSK